MSAALLAPLFVPELARRQNLRRRWRKRARPLRYGLWEGLCTARDLRLVVIACKNYLSPMTHNNPNPAQAAYRRLAIQRWTSSVMTMMPKTPT